MSIQDAIRSIRESKGITQEELAEKLQRTRSNYAYLESRGEKLTIEQLQRIATALNVSLSEILGFPVNTAEQVEQLENEIEELKKENKAQKQTIDALSKALNKLFDTPMGKLLKNIATKPDDAPPVKPGESKGYFDDLFKEEEK